MGVMRGIHGDEQGFTLIELLVVILIIGILAAIALPIFLNQREKGQDADAKTNARNMESLVEACRVDATDYTQCTPPIMATTGLKVGASPGEVDMTAPGPDGYVITAYSKTGTDFVITRNGVGDVSRTCSAAGQGGCPATGTW